MDLPWDEHQFFGLMLWAIGLLAVGGVVWHVFSQQILTREQAVHRGKVSVEAINWVDLIGVGLWVLIFYWIWWSSPAIQGGEITKQGIMMQGMLQGIWICVVVLIMRGRISPVDFWGLNWRRWPWVFVIAPLSVMAMIALLWGLEFAGYQEWIKTLFGKAEEQGTVQALRNIKDSTVLGLLTLIVLIGAPLSEEVLFRGYLYPVFKRYAGCCFSAIFSAALFSAVHGNAAAFLPLFVFGLILTIVYELTGSLWSSISCHVLFNLIMILNVRSMV